MLELKQITIMNLQMYTKIIELILMTIFSFFVKYTKKMFLIIEMYKVQNSTNLKSTRFVWALDIFIAL